MKYKRLIRMTEVLVLSLIAALSLGLLDYCLAANKLMPTFFEIPLSFFLIYWAIFFVFLVLVKFIWIPLVNKYSFCIAALLLCGVIIIFIAWIFEKPTIQSIESTERPGKSIASGMKTKPDILLILVDALSPEHCKCYGYRKDITPNIDSLAKSGVLFEKAYAVSNFTLSSCASLLTSLYPSVHKMRWSGDMLPEEVPYLPKLLQENGYTTAVWSMNRYISSLYGFEKNVNDFYLLDLQCYWPINEILPNTFLCKLLNSFGLANILERSPLKTVTLERKYFQGEDKIMTEHLLDWLRRKRERPYFCYVHYIAPHDPYWPPPEYRPKGSRKYGHLVGGEGNLKKREDLLALYDGEIQYEDDLIGQVVKYLKSTNSYNSTIVILTADHGEEFGQHGHWAHGTSFYEEALHIPLIISYPEKIVRGKKLRALVSNVDTMPTILGLADVPQPYGLDGASLLPLMEGAEDANRVIFAERFRKHESTRSVFDSDYKYICRKTDEGIREMIFDRKADPGEKQDISIKRPDILNQYRGLTSKIIQKTAKMAEKMKSRRRDIDSFSQKKLKALGYIE